MDCEKFNNEYRIKSARYEFHKYDYGEYFITICTKNHRCHFGFIDDGKMTLSDIGRHVECSISNLKEHYPFVNIPAYVVMPNHIHLIVVVCEDNDRQQNIANMNVSARKGRLSHVVGSIKASVTKYANERNIPFCWQTRFYDCIIRSNIEFMEYMHYIESNVENWHKDDCYRELQMGQRLQ